MSVSTPIRQLSAEVARKIAAGEVIDRPNAIVRELMDNAVDAGASKITVEIEGGGIEKVRLVDNGFGMTKEDLYVCARPHATSKISTETDLLKLSTLGFRGEALSSIAAVCRLSIISGGYKMCASVTEDHIIEPATPIAGSIVQAEGLFENFPARRIFLKRPASESLMCKNTFIEKSLPCPDRSFRFISDGTIKLDLPAGQSHTERFTSAMEIKEDPSLFYEITGAASGTNPAWKFSIVTGEPGVYRSSKKDIYIFVNGRRITEYSLVQAVEYGAQGYFPNGTYPVAAVFVTIDPALVDFNIHPAKKEARFKDISELHHGISSTLRSFFNNYTRKTLFSKEKQEEQRPELFETSLTAENKKPRSFYPADTGSMRSKFFASSGAGLTRTEKKRAGAKNSSYSAPYEPKTQTSAAYSISHEDSVIELVDKAIAAYKRTEGQQPANEENEAAAEIRMPEIKPAPAGSISAIPAESEIPAGSAAESAFHFVGSSLGTFIIAEKNNTLYIIDKHAAHERILYNKIIENQGKRQELLVPYTIETQSESDDRYLETIKDELGKIGFSCTNAGNGKWEFTSLPERWKGSEEDLYHALLDSRVRPQEIIYRIAATAACKAAVKDGCVLDDDTAADIAEQALNLPDPHCPHGRPIYTAITRGQLFALVRRT